MYSVENITKLVAEKTVDTDLFLVEVTISKDNKISVFVDSEKGVAIDACVGISRHIESSLDREIEDFELEVSSAGIGYPFKVPQQYINNVGKDVEIILKSGIKLNGVLKSYNETGISLEIEKMIKPEGKKRKQLVVETEKYNHEEIKTIKLLLLI